MKLGQWVTSAEADSISFRPVSLGRKLYSLAQHDFSSFKSKLSMALRSLILENNIFQWFCITIQEKINCITQGNNNVPTLKREEKRAYKCGLLNHTYWVSGVTGRSLHRPKPYKFLLSFDHNTVDTIVQTD